MKYLDAIPDELKALRQWVCADNGEKAPMRADSSFPASTSSPATWSDFETARKAVETGLHDWVGFVFHGNGIVGIDIDCGWEDDLPSQTALDIVFGCQSYTELSRSGRGFHILLKGTLPFNGKNNQHGVEIYQTGRYFIMTGRTQIFHSIAENQAAIDSVIETYFPDVRTTSGKGAIAPRIYNPKWPKPNGGKIPLRPNYPQIPQGARNICLTSLAGMMHTQGYPKSQISRELLYANETACKPPLAKKEIQSIVNSVTRYERT